MTGALLLAAVLAAAPKAADAPRVKALAPAARAHAGEETACGACHTTEGWTVVKFDHARTGFPLRGQHVRAGCKACHPVDFERALPTSCRGCHRDAHAGELGARCEACHDEGSWRSRYSADAHRRAAFPLVGAHAQLPCEECHAAAADRRFSRSVAECFACHQRDYQRTALGALDHERLGFPTDCRQCHGMWVFRPGRFPGHDLCFQLGGGPHAGVACLTCHTGVPPVTALGACATNTAACSGCHVHRCAEMDQKHAEEGVPGYQCKDRKCWECHRFSRGAAP